MFQFSLAAHAEKCAPGHRIPGYHASQPLLDHQARTYAALEQHHLVMNTYPTGTGKTIAALLWLLNPLMNTSGNTRTLMIAPTNALVDQHADDIEAFAQQQQLELNVFRVNARLIDQFEDDLTLRRGERLQRFLENPLTFYKELGLPAATQKKPYVMVTNPDIFYLALYFQYAKLDQRNVFFQFFLSLFRYVIIDEFHYYDSKQFANFLFFFSLWQQWNRFANQCKVCLLSATPTDLVYRYLDRVFGADGWSQVSPANEPATSANLPTVPTLAPLNVTVTTGLIQDWAEQQRGEIMAWNAQQLDSVLISSSLSQINRIYDVLRPINPVRITGPEDRQERRREAYTILATPTVDIGYNFGRAGKQHQSIDRLVCDARFGDELTQRIGRAGRVLGRAITDQPSEAVLIVSDDAYAELQPYAGRSLPRAEWAQIVGGLHSLPAKHRLDSYIRSYAISESFYPILKIHDAGAIEGAEALFEQVKAVFAPSSRLTWKRLTGLVKCQADRQQWLNIGDPERWGPAAVVHIKHFLRWKLQMLTKVDQTVSDAEARDYWNQIKRLPDFKAAIENFIRQQVAISSAVFHFREAWQGPEAVVFDPERRLSTRMVNHYDLFHCMMNYQIRLLDQAALKHLTGVDEVAAFYIALDDFRTPKLNLYFAYHSTLDKKEFEQFHCSGVTALQNLRIQAREQVTQNLVLLEASLVDAIAKQPVPCLLVPSELLGALISVTRGTPFFSRECVVTFPNGIAETYTIITGTAALHVVTDYNNRARMINRQRHATDEPIFC